MTFAVRFPCASRCAEFSSHTHDSAFDESEKEGHDIRLTYIDRRIKENINTCKMTDEVIKASSISTTPRPLF